MNSTKRFIVLIHTLNCLVHIKMEIVKSDSSNITLFYGEGVTEEDTANLLSKLEEKYPDIDISVVFGGQPVYYYIISVE